MYNYIQFNKWQCDTSEYNKAVYTIRAVEAIVDPNMIDQPWPWEDEHTKLKLILQEAAVFVLEAQELI